MPFGGAHKHLFLFCMCNRECRGRSQSVVGPRKLWEVANLFSNMLISVIPGYKPNKFQAKATDKMIGSQLTRKISVLAYRQEYKNGSFLITGINVAYKLFKKLVVNDIVI